MVNALWNIRQLRPFARYRVEAPEHLLGLPAGEHAEAAEDVEFSARRRPVDLLLALRDWFQAGPFPLGDRRAGHQDELSVRKPPPLSEYAWKSSHSILLNMLRHMLGGAVKRLCQALCLRPQLSRRPAAMSMMASVLPTTGTSMGRLQGKVAIVTGAGGGIGTAISRQFACEGAAVVGVDIDAGALVGWRRRCAAAGGGVVDAVRRCRRRSDSGGRGGARAGRVRASRRAGVERGL